MNLKQVIQKNDAKEVVPYKELKKYWNSLYVYYKNQFDNMEPIIMVDVISNSVQRSFIVSPYFADEFCEYIKKHYPDIDIRSLDDIEDLDLFEQIALNSFTMEPNKN
jgi:hypothetical protein